jgi:hypothetical protein
MKKNNKTKDYGCLILSLIALIPLFFLVYMLFFNEDVYQKEERIVDEINDLFLKSIDSNFKNEIETLSNYDTCNVYDISKKICPIEMTCYKNLNEVVGVDHNLSKELLANNCNVTFDVNKADNFIITLYKDEIIGEYRNSDGKFFSDAKIPTIEVYTYDVKMKAFCLAFILKGGKPEDVINRYSESTGYWPFDKILPTLFNNSNLKTKNLKGGLTSEEYIEKLEQSMNLGLN